MSAIDLPADDREGGDMRSRLVLVSFLSAGLLAVGATPALARGTVDQEQLDMSGGVAWGNYLTVGQTITAGASGAMDSVAVHPVLFPIGGLTLEIRTVSGGLPTTTVLASETISSNVFGNWVTTTFASPALVVAGTQYALLITNPTEKELCFDGSRGGTDLYAGGTALALARFGWSVVDLDIAFITYVTPAQPDGLIARGSRKFAGNDIYNTDATQQTRLATPHIGDLVLFRVAVQNDGIVPDSFKIQAAGSEPYYSIRYYRHSKEITSRVVAGTFTTPVIAPGDRYVIRVWVKVATHAAAPSASRLVTLTSVNDPTKVDAVKFVVRPR